MKRLSATVLVVLGLLCSTADARLVGGVRVAESLRIAQEFWGDTPHCTAVRVYAASDARLEELTGVPAVGAAAWADIDKPAAECPIYVTEGLVVNDYVARIRFCTVVVHEYGHVLRFVHDETPNSLMNVQKSWEVYARYRRFLPKGKGGEWRRAFRDTGWAIKPERKAENSNPSPVRDRSG